MSSGFWFKRRWQTKKTAEDYFAERRARRRRQVAAGAAFPITFVMIADRDNLYHTYLGLKRDGGQAAGVDGVCYPDLTNSEAGELIADLSARVLSGRYTPAPVRSVDIPKTGSSGTRRLSIPTVLDRVLAKALSDALTPFWEKIFLPCSWGFRPRRNAWGMLLSIEQVVKTTGKRVIALDDLKSAFDNVPHAAIVDAHERMLDTVPGVKKSGRKAEWQKEKNAIIELVKSVLRIETGVETVGIAQGNNYSPTCLNSVLHYSTDVPISGTITKPLYARYADNFAFLVKSVTEGERALSKLRRYLPKGMPLKGVDGVFDLRNGDEAHLLGFDIRLQNDDMICGTSKVALNHLEESLKRSFETENPISTASAVLNGWIASIGPAFETGVAETVVGVTRLLCENGFRELAVRDLLMQKCNAALSRWLEFRTGFRHPEPAFEIG